LFTGKEADDNRLLTEADDATMSVTVNSGGAYRSVCVEIELVPSLLNQFAEINPSLHERQKADPFKKTGTVRNFTILFFARSKTWIHFFFSCKPGLTVENCL
jgi:hypothetical protein